MYACEIEKLLFSLSLFHECDLELVVWLSTFIVYRELFLSLSFDRGGMRESARVPARSFELSVQSEESLIIQHQIWVLPLWIKIMENGTRVTPHTLIYTLQGGHGETINDDEVYHQNLFRFCVIPHHQGTFSVSRKWTIFTFNMILSWKSHCSLLVFFER